MAGMRRWIGIGLSLLPLVLCALLIRRYGVNMFVSDELGFTEFVRHLRAGYWDVWWGMVTHLNNMHGMLPYKLIVTVLALFGAWNGVTETWIGLAVLAVELWLCWRIFRRLWGNDPLAFVPVAWLIATLTQHMNLLSGINMNYFFTSAGALAAFYFLERRTRWTFVAALLGAALAGSSIMNGLLAWPVGGLMLALARRWRALIVWSLVATTCIVAYFTVFYAEPLMKPSIFGFLQMPADTLLFVVVTLGQPIAGPNSQVAAVAGVLLLLGMAALIVHFWRRGEGQRVLVPSAMILFAVLSACMTAVGRIGFGLEWSVESRYTTASVLAPAGAYMMALLWLRDAHPQRLQAFLVLACLVPLVGDMQAVRDAARWRGYQQKQKFTLQAMDSVPDRALGDLCEFGRAAPCRMQLKYLRSERLGPFSDPADIVFPVSWKEATPAEELGPNQSIEQRFVCTVPELHDVGAAFATYPGKEPSALTVRLLHGKEELTKRDFAPHQIRGNRFGYLVLGETLRHCIGKILTLKVEATGAPGRAVTVWTYPQYLQGELRQAGRVILGRTLGLSLNEVHYGVQRM
jgi:hypothetical protein